MGSRSDRACVSDRAKSLFPKRRIIMDTNTKLVQVRKSCKVLEILFKVLKIICIVGACMCLIGSLVCGILSNKIIKFNKEAGNSTNYKIYLHLFDNDIISYEDGKLEGPFAPALEKAFEERIKDELGINGSVNLDGVFEGEYGENAVDLLNSFARIGMVLGMIFAAIMSAAAAVVWWLIERIFKEIKESDSPFTESILKKLKVVFIIISILPLFTNGVGAAIVTALICWAIYCIIDYGYALQNEVDETL